MIKRIRAVVSILFALLLMLPAIPASAAVSAWEAVGMAGFSIGGAEYVSFAFSGDIPYVAYSDVANGNKAIVMKYNGTDWVTVGNAGFSAGEAYSLSLAFCAGTPYVAYMDASADNKATVMKFNGTDWVTVGNAGFSAGGAGEVSLAFNGNVPYVAYNDISTNLKATVMKYDGVAWVPVGNPGFSNGQAIMLSLAFSGNTPYVAYRDEYTGYKTTVMRYNGTAWVPVGNVGFTSDLIAHISFAFNGDTPYVAYTDTANGYKASVMKYNGIAWVPVGNLGFSSGKTEVVSLAFSGDTPYVAYQDVDNSCRAMVMKYNGTDWATVGGAPITLNQADSLVIACKGGIPYIAYGDYGNLGKATVMRFSTYGSVTINGTAGAVYQIKQGSTVIRDDVTIPAGGSVTVSDLLIGTYTVAEKTPPAGYLANITPQDAVLTTDGQAVSLTFVSCLPIVTAVSGNSSYGSVSGGGTYTVGATATLTATQNTGYYFTGWYTDSTLVSSNAIYSFTVKADTTLTAKFEAVKQKYKITAVSSNNSCGSVSGGGDYTKGTSVTLTATPKSGSYFTGWYDGNTLVCASTSYMFTAVANVTLTAQFDKVGIPATITATATTYNKIKLSWAVVSGVKGYQIYRATSAAGTYKLMKTTSSTSYVNSDVKTGTTYYYKVRAYTKSGSKKIYGSYYSTIATATPTLAQATGAKAIAVNPSSTKLSWSAVAGKTKYEVWRSTTADSMYTLVKTISSRSYKDSNLAPNTTYYYKIRAYRTVSGAKVYGAYSSVISATPTMGQVTGARAARVNDTKIKISWKEVTGKTRYEIWVSASADGEYTLLTETSSRSYTHKNLTDGTTYYYRIRTYRMVGGVKYYGAYSSVLSATP